jgi:AhpD family alkylhydroperoxidase
MSRMNPYLAAPELVKPLIAYATAAHDSGLEPSLQLLVKIRASQINGCAVCLDMHVTAAVRAGESDMRIHLLYAWSESGMFTPREVAALAWTDALTRLTETGAPDEAYFEVMSQFSEKEVVALTLLIGNINTFNRLGVGFRLPPIALQRAEAAA